MSRFLSALSRLVYSYHKIILAAALAASAFSVFLISRIEMKTDLMDVMPSQSPSLNLFTEVMEDSGNLNALTIVISSEDNDMEKYTHVIESVGRRLGRSPMIRDVDYSIFNFPMEFMMKYFPLYLSDRGIQSLKEKLSGEGIRDQIRNNYLTLASPFSTPADVEMISGDPLNLRALFTSSSFGERPPNMDLGTGYYLGKDRSSAFIFTSPAGSSRDMGFVNALKKEVGRIVNETLEEHGAGHLNAGFTGGHAVSWEVNESLRKDMVFSALLTVVLVLLIFRLFYKGSTAAIAVILCTIAAALLLTLTCAYFLYGGLNMVTALVSAMLIGLGIDFCLHVYGRYIMEFSRSRNTLSALEITFSRTGRSVVTGALTTALAFFSIVITSFRGLHELGVIAGIGVLSCMLSSIFIMGSLLVWISAGRRSQYLFQGRNNFLEHTVPDFLIKRRKPFLAVIAVIILLASAGIWKIEFVSDIYQIGLRKSSAVDLQKRLSGTIGGGGDPLVVTYSGKDGVDNAFDKMEKMLAGWKSRGYTRRHNSLGGLLPPLYRQREVIEQLADIRERAGAVKEIFISSLSENGFNVHESDTSYISGIVTAIKNTALISPDDLPAGIQPEAGHFYNADKDRISAYIFPVGGEWERSVLNTLQQETEAAGQGWRLTGWPLVSPELKKTIISESVLAALISFVLILAFIYFHFRTFRIMFLTQLPLLLGLAMTLGIMGASGTGFNYINISAIAMIFGISVDYGVYMMQALLENRRSHNNRIMRHAFKNIVICSLTTIAGFGSLVTTNFRGISSLGLVIIIGIVSCFTISTALMPLSEHFLERKT